MRLQFQNTPTEEAVRTVCSSFGLSLSAFMVNFDGSVTSDFDAQTAEEAVERLFAGSTFAGWIEQAWGPGEVLVVHDRRGLDEKWSYDHEGGDLADLFRCIEELFPLGFSSGIQTWRAVDRFSLHDWTLRATLDLVCAKGGLTWREARGVVFVSDARPNQTAHPTTL